ncbi:MAG TPA: GNAT family N-acetyltransferase [Solirubrobacteraceae bacterium]|jgi:GNAT superfamily N-acetyltransferase|nr:GNAT family N-acetyltransferase [Solirubrobacteraceae bacterium]
MARRLIAGGLELDDDRARIDLDAVHDYIANQSYWARGRSREDMEGAVAGAARVVGLYDGEEQVGFARVVSDGVTIAYLADVYVLERYRGHGVGVELVREAVDNGPHSGLRWWLATQDAHGLYERFGFEPPDARFMGREARR